MTRAALALVALACAPALADEGELFLGGAVALEAALLRHPLAGGGLIVDDRTAFAVIPRATLSAQYGWTNELHWGVALDAGASANVITRGLAIGGAQGELVTGGYFDVAALGTASWRFDSGLDVTGVLGLELGPSLVLWSANALADPTKLDDAGRPARLPLDIADEWQLGAIARVTVVFKARLFEWFAVSCGPYLAARWSGAPALHTGIVLEPSLIVAPPLQ